MADPWSLMRLTQCFTWCYAKTIMLQDNVPIQTARMMHVSLMSSYLHQQPRQVGLATPWTSFLVMLPSVEFPG
jgi:hypothetical protein